MDIEGKLSFDGRHGHASNNSIQHGLGIHPFCFDSNLAAFNAGKIQGIINQGQQQLPGLANLGKIIFLLGLAFCFQGKIRKGQNTIQRGTHIMADTCQEYRFGGIGLVRHSQSFLQLLQLFPLLLVLLGNITLDNKNRSTAAIKITGLHSVADILLLRAFP